MNMHTLAMIFLLLFIHWIADFVFQTDEMAKRKSSSKKWLTLHVLVYSAFFIMFGPIYALVNGLLHWCIDFFTSKASSYLYKQNRIHDFFVVVGFDQMLHAFCLIGTAYYLGVLK